MSIRPVSLGPRARSSTQVLNSNAWKGLLLARALHAPRTSPCIICWSRHRIQVLSGHRVPKRLQPTGCASHTRSCSGARAVRCRSDRGGRLARRSSARCSCGTASAGTCFRLLPNTLWSPHPRRSSRLCRTAKTLEESRTHSLGVRSAVRPSWCAPVRRPRVCRSACRSRPRPGAKIWHWLPRPLSNVHLAVGSRQPCDRDDGTHGSAAQRGRAVSREPDQ